MTSSLRSLAVWSSTIALVLVWTPLVALSRVFDRDPVLYRTGRLFRRLGIAMTRLNPLWDLTISGENIENPRRPYVVVSNHQSYADIPLVSNLPWEMKWVGKVELFRIPFVGWMMRMARDIPVDRSDKRSRAGAMILAKSTLDRRCSVMFFPEGTRSPDGRVHAFNDGAFHLAIRAGVPILPLAIDGSRDCLPKNSWKFGEPSTIRLRVLPPIETAGLQKEGAPELKKRVRLLIVDQIAAWRGKERRDVDALDGGGAG